MDPSSDVLSLLRPRSYITAGLDAGGDWAVRFDDVAGRIKCYAVAHGACWLSVDGEETPVRLQAGDCFVLASGRPFTLASDLALPPVGPTGETPELSPFPAWLSDIRRFRSGRRRPI